MTAQHSHDSSTTLNTRMLTCGVNERLKDYITRCVVFHTSPAPGVLIGAFIMDYALELLGAIPGEKLFAVCETPKCLPDAPQVIANCTTGNNRLKVLPIGKFAITLNRASDNRQPKVSGYMSMGKNSKNSRSSICGMPTTRNLTNTPWVMCSRKKFSGTAGISCPQNG